MTSTAPDWKTPHRETFEKLPEGQADFDALMGDALTALHAEDEDLNARFTKSNWPAPLLDAYSQGVGSLFEPTLCFTIFKRLLGTPAAHVLG